MLRQETNLLFIKWQHAGGQEKYGVVVNLFVGEKAPAETGMGNGPAEQA
jgi:hypothetical protein